MTNRLDQLEEAGPRYRRLASDPDDRRGVLDRADRVQGRAVWEAALGVQAAQGSAVRGSALTVRASASGSNEPACGACMLGVREAAGSRSSGLGFRHASARGG